MISRAIAILGLSSCLFGLLLLGLVASAAKSELPSDQHSAAGAKTQNTKLIGFVDWKSEIIHSRANDLRQIRARLAQEKLNPNHSSTQTLSDLEQELAQKQWNLEAAKELTMREYLTIYLAPLRLHKNLKAEELAAVLSRAEVGLLLETSLQILQTPPTPSNPPSSTPPSSAATASIFGSSANP